MYEQQTITLADMTGALKLRRDGSDYASEWTPDVKEMNAAAFAKNLELSSMGIGDVHVTRTNRTGAAGEFGFSWTVTFLDYEGDFPMLLHDAGLVTAGTVEIEEFIKGSANEFTIEPKKASGMPVKDVTTAAGLDGKDVFFTELWDAAGDGWYTDGGEASYNPVTYAVQSVTIPSTSNGNYAGGLTFALTLDRTPQGVTDTTSNLDGDDGSFATALDVKNALEALANIEAVDVTVTDDSTDRVYLVTFTHDLGDIPLLGVDNTIATAAVANVQTGVTEIQSVVTSCDEEFVRDEQHLSITGGGTFDLCYGSSGLYCATGISGTASASDIETALEGLAPITDVSVSATDATNFQITFLDPVGNIPDLEDGGGATTATVTETVAGASALGGTFTLAYAGDYTADIDFDASADDVKATLEALPSIDEVMVSKEDLGQGHKFTVTFTKQPGSSRRRTTRGRRPRISPRRCRPANLP